MAAAKTRPTFRTAYDGAPPHPGLKGFGPTLTQQHFKDDVDINVLLERFKVTGVMPQAVRLPQYGDYRGIGDYQTAMNAMLEAQHNFNQLPAKVRARFGNSPQQFLEFVSDSKNAEELVKLGLAKAIKATPAASPAPTPSPTPAPTK